MNDIAKVKLFDMLFYYDTNIFMFGIDMDELSEEVINRIIIELED